MSDIPENAQQRRTFLGIMLGAIGAVIAGAFSWPLFRYLSPIDKGGTAEQVRVARQQVKGGGGPLFLLSGAACCCLAASSRRVCCADCGVYSPWLYRQVG